MFCKINFKLYFLILILIIFSFNLRSEVVNKIEINSNKRISDETVILYGKINIKEDLNEKKINDIINNLNSTNFFEDINLEIRNNILVLNLKDILLLIK